MVSTLLFIITLTVVDLEAGASPGVLRGGSGSHVLLCPIGSRDFSVNNGAGSTVLPALSLFDHSQDLSLSSLRGRGLLPNVSHTFFL